MDEAADDDAETAAADRLQLTKRELEVVALVVDGLSNQQIAEKLNVTRRTAQSHVASSMKKLGARSRTQLAVFALRRGLVPLHPEEPQ